MQIIVTGEQNYEIKMKLFSILSYLTLNRLQKE